MNAHRRPTGVPAVMELSEADPQNSNLEEKIENVQITNYDVKLIERIQEAQE